MFNDKKYNHSYGFTLTEVLVVLVILGALALILIPNLSRILPNDHNIKYKKAFYTIQEIVYDIVNDPSTCQDMNYDTVNQTWEVPDTEDRRNQVMTMCYTDTNPPTARSLDVVICSRLSTDTCGVANSNHNVLTTNGMRWNLPNQGMADTSNDNWNTVIYVDVDGGNNAPGNARVEGDGVYAITVSSNGRVLPGNTTTGNAADVSVEQGLLLNNPTGD